MNEIKHVEKIRVSFKGIILILKSINTGKNNIFTSNVEECHRHRVLNLNYKS